MTSTTEQITRITCQKCFSTILPKLGCLCTKVVESESTVKTKLCTDMSAESGVTYQRCGGGRRIIRKKIGGD